MRAPNPSFPPHAVPATTSQRLRALAEAAPPRIAVADLLAALGERGFGLLLLIFALPNAIPVPAPPGTSAVLAVPLALVAAQMALGLERPRLPGWLRRLSLSRALLHKAPPYLARLERHLRPRRPAFASERLLGLACLALALVLMLPVPLGNAPVAWAVLLIALALLERDGLFAIGGLAAGAAAVAWNALLIFAGGQVVVEVADVVAQAL